MIPRVIYTALGIMVCPLDKYRTPAVIPGRVYTALGIITCPLD